MPQLFSFASWNVEHFTNDPDRIGDNIAFLSESDPDVFAIFEVEGGQVFSHFIEQMPTHNFFITEDLSRMETLVGVRRDFTAFVTQRQQFKSDIPTLRPGALATLMIDGVAYCLLFLHTKSANDPRSWGLRDDMIGHAINLKKALDDRTDAEDGANFLCIGDLNTMGMNLTYSDKDVDGAEEVERYAKRVRHCNMRLLTKTHDRTWWGGGATPPSNLDHALASTHLTFRQFNGADLAVRGWPELDGEEAQREWISAHSDHAVLFGVVES